jgi:hypothetical protein
MVDKNLIDYISKSLSSGITEEEIKKTLSGVGWKQEDVIAAFAEVDKEKSTLPQPELNPEQEAELKQEIKPEQKPEIHAVTIPAEVKQGGFGDGSMTSLYDLAMPKIDSVNIPKEKTQTDQPAAAVMPMKEPAALKVENRVAETTEKKPTAKSSSKTLLIVIGVFVVMSLIGMLIWWLFGREKPVAQSQSQQMSQTAEIPTEAASKMANTALVLSDTEFVSQKGFSITPPKDWVADETGTFGTLATFTNPKSDEDAGNKFAANINIVTEAAQNTDLKAYLESSKELLSKTFSVYTKISENEVTVGGHQGVLIEAKYDLGAYSLHNVQLITKIGEAFYVVTGTCMESNWNEYKDVMEKSLMTFK